MRLVDWFKKQIFKLIHICDEEYQNLVIHNNGLQRQNEEFKLRIAELKDAMEKLLAPVAIEEKLRPVFREMFKTDMPINCQHQNVIVREATLTNFYGEKSEIKATYCNDCETILKKGTTRGVIQLVRKSCEFCHNTGNEAFPYMNGGYTLEKCRLEENCPRLRGKLNDKENPSRSS